MEKELYVVNEGGVFVLRQTQFAEMLENGIEHPHDVCAYTHTLEEMHEMCDKYWPNEIDYSRVES